MHCGDLPVCSLSHHLLSLTTNWRNPSFRSNKSSRIRQISGWKLFRAELAFTGIALLSVVETILSIAITIFSGPLLLIHIAPSLLLHLWYKDSLMSCVCSFKTLYNNLNEPYLKKTI